MERFALHASVWPVMVRFDGSDGPQSDLVVGHPGIFPARRGVLRRVEGRRGERFTRSARSTARRARGTGAGLAALGLKPGARVSSRAFERLLQGHVPGTEIRLGRVRHGGHERRPGFDLTFSAPKSVSLAALLPTERHPRGDRSVVRAHDEAVRATLDWVEETLLETRGWDPETRQRPRVKAPFMAAATFRHVASRNLDPQLHTHAVIANVTRDAGRVGGGAWIPLRFTATRA